MKRVLNENSNQSSKKIKKSSSLLSPHFLTINTGLTYSSILGYRVIIGNGKNLPEVIDFNSQVEAEKYLHDYYLKCDYCLIRALVFQDGFYLENEQGKIIDINTGKKYQFINKTRVSEWDLNKLDYNPVFRIF